MQIHLYLCLMCIVCIVFCLFLANERREEVGRISKYNCTKAYKNTAHFFSIKVIVNTCIS